MSRYSWADCIFDKMQTTPASIINTKCVRFQGGKKTSNKNYVLKLCSLLLYTCCCTHEERQISILQRATNHLLGVFPGYQVNSGQNRKAQCRVEMAQRRRWSQINRRLKSCEELKTPAAPHAKARPFAFRELTESRAWKFVSPFWFSKEST